MGVIACALGWFALLAAGPARAELAVAGGAGSSSPPEIRGDGPLAAVKPPPGEQPQGPPAPSVEEAIARATARAAAIRQGAEDPEFQQGSIPPGGSAGSSGNAFACAIAVRYCQDPNPAVAAGCIGSMIRALGCAAY